MRNAVHAERKSDREIVSGRTIHGPASRVFEAWSQAEHFQEWWIPKSFPITLTSCEMDVRNGGTYRLTFSAGGQTAEFYGKYLEVTPGLRLVWTNEESGADAATVTTVTFEEMDGGTWVSVLDLYPSQAALDEAIQSGSAGALPEQLSQLDEFMLRRLNSTS